MTQKVGSWNILTLILPKCLHSCIYHKLKATNAGSCSLDVVQVRRSSVFFRLFFITELSICEAEMSLQVEDQNNIPLGTGQL